VNLTPGQLDRIGQLSDQWSFLWDKRRSLWIAAEDCPDGEQIEEANLDILLLGCQRFAERAGSAERAEGLADRGGGESGPVRLENSKYRCQEAGQNLTREGDVRVGALRRPGNAPINNALVEERAIDVIGTGPGALLGSSPVD
jgi:hypothetical protein